MFMAEEEIMKTPGDGLEPVQLQGDRLGRVRPPPGIWALGRRSCHLPGLTGVVTTP